MPDYYYFFVLLGVVFGCLYMEDRENFDDWTALLILSCIPYFNALWAFLCFSLWILDALEEWKRFCKTLKLKSRK